MALSPRSSCSEPTLDRFDYLDIPAILFPISDSAILSSELSANKQKSTSIPCSDLTSSNPRKISPEKPQKRKSASAEVLVLKLEPSKDTSRYSLGSSHDNYIVLQSTDEEECYVNYMHCQLIPDPDKDSMVLYNGSTSAFRAQDQTEESPVRSILPTSEHTFSCGNWYLELGKGLEFLLRVLPRHPELYTELLASCETESVTSIGIGEKGISRRCSSSQRSTKSMTRLSPGLETIGQTNMTQVFRVRQRGRVVAAKVCRKPEVKWAAETWANEMHILSDLKHRSVVRMLDFDGSHLTIYLEYIEGTDLSRLVDKDRISRVPEADRYRVWKDISSALEYIHGHDIIHNDIKPGNIVLGKGQRGAVLCDFGIASSGSKLQYGGTPCYIPPEFIYGKRAKPSDIWAFGITMLFVSGLLRLPSGTWQIAEIERDIETLAQMVDWLDKVKALRARVPKHLGLLRGMLTEDANKRTTASALVKCVAEITTDKEPDIAA